MPKPFPKPTFPHTSRVMRAVKGKDTSPELRLRKALWRAGARGYRLHVKRLPGSPDIVFRRAGLAVFVNGCFWHRCPHCPPSTPKNNVAYWQEKFARNVARDRRNHAALRALGWTPLVIWECEIKAGAEKQALRVRSWL